MTFCDDAISAIALKCIDTVQCYGGKYTLKAASQDIWNYIYFLCVAEILSCNFDRLFLAEIRKVAFGVLESCIPEYTYDGSFSCK